MAVLMEQTILHDSCTKANYRKIWQGCEAATRQPQRKVSVYYSKKGFLELSSIPLCLLFSSFHDNFLECLTRP